jgi:hypothetical protein
VKWPDSVNLGTAHSSRVRFPIAKCRSNHVGPNRTVRRKLSKTVALPHVGITATTTKHHTLLSEFSSGVVRRSAFPTSACWTIWTAFVVSLQSSLRQEDRDNHSRRYTQEPSLDSPSLAEGMARNPSARDDECQIQKLKERHPKASVALQSSCHRRRLAKHPDYTHRHGIARFSA